MSTIIREPINCDYEYIQYNKKLRIVHSIDDDMYQVNSIIKACNSNKLSADWYRNKETQSLIEAFEHDRDLMGSLPVDNRINTPNGLRGLYVHRLLVNDVARWASPRYALQIYKLLDQMATAEREEMESTIQHQRPLRKHYEDESERWFYRDNLPISMSVNKDIKEIIKQIVPIGEYEMNGCDIRLHSKYLVQLYESISEYFNHFQK
ncbi:hypothetical protein M9Y10_006361 [Tritrichomonas musculus]|uniref:KilA-N domain-containing protein n=1 Tax=Tritrichomonas musculus TaxID=1915356 RepID=A0ABR2GX27_9EUKA